MRYRKFFTFVPAGPCVSFPYLLGINAFEVVHCDGICKFTIKLKQFTQIVERGHDRSIFQLLRCRVFDFVFNRGVAAGPRIKRFQPTGDKRLPVHVTKKGIQFDKGITDGRSSCEI